MREALRVVARMGLAEFLALGMLGCALLLAVALVAAAAVARPGAGWVVRAIARAEAACLGSALLGFALVTDARRRLAAIEHPFGAYPLTGNVSHWADTFEQTESALFVTGATTAVIAVLLATAAIVWQARTGAGATRAAAHLFAALLLGVTALGIARHAYAATHWPSTGWATSRGASRRCCPLATAPSPVRAAWRPARRGRGRGARGRRGVERPARGSRRRAWLGAALALLSGVVAQRATRATAADAHLSVPREPGEADCPAAPALARALPPAELCDAWLDGPTIEVSDGSARLDGIPHTPEVLGPRPRGEARVDDRRPRQRAPLASALGDVRRPGVGAAARADFVPPRRPRQPRAPTWPSPACAPTAPSQPARSASSRSAPGAA